jgi:uncharacterized protein YceK
MRACLVCLVLPCVVAATGCGTAGNIFLNSKEPHLYGGVEIDYEALQRAWSRSEPGEEAKPALARTGEAILWTAFLALDLPLCLVADTITLPDVLLQSGFRGWGFEEGPPGSGPAGPTVAPHPDAAVSP